MQKNLLLVLCLLVFSQCKPQQALEDGTYVGTFTVKYEDGKKSGPVTVVLENGRYTSSSNPDLIPAGGFGTFSVQGNEIAFNDSGIYTADFDWNLILGGNYQYSFNGQKLTLEADKNDVGNYRYVLQKQD
jgi:hypothetical protein